jgi:hypothetical protein
MGLSRVVALLLVSLVTGCVSARVVRLETGRGEPIVFAVRTGEFAPVELEQEEFQEALSGSARSVRPPSNPQQAARQLFEAEARGGSYLFNPRTRRVTPLDGTALIPETDAELKRAYLHWCERTGRPGDCLRLLVQGSTLEREGRFVLALALAQGTVLDEMLEGFKDMADPHAMLAASLWTCTLYLVLWSVPEPVSKGIAAVMTATLIVYLGVDTFWSLVTGFRRLMDDADRALTFDELREAGQRYGKVLGRNAARAFALLATVAIGNTAAGFASRVPTLPGSAQASMQAGAAVGIRLAAVGEVGTVAVTGETVIVALAPGAVAMTARATSGVAGTPVDA